MKKQKAKGSGMKRLALSVTFLTSSLVPLTTYGADGILRGRVTDKADGEGVVGAAVSIAGTNIATATDIDGNFVLRNVPPSQQKVTVTSIGYAPTTQVIAVGDGQTATLNFALGQTTIMASEVVVGAALYKQDRLEVPVTANVVSKEKIKEEPNPTLDKVIEDVPGVNINRSAGYSTSTVQIRGSNTFQGGGIGTRVNAFYDGYPINTPETGEIVWTNINMNAAEKAEVLKGAAATLYGSGAMGGVVNVYGSLPDKFEVKAGVSGGFYDAPPSSDESVYRKDFTPWQWNSYVGIGNKTGKWNYSILYSHGEDDGYRENTWSSIDDVKLKIRYNIDAKQYLQMSSFYTESRGGYASTWPYELQSLTQAGAVYNPYPELAYDAANEVYADDTIKRKNALIGLNYVNLLSEKLSLDTKLYYTHNSTRIDYNPTSTEQLFFTSDMITGNATLQASATAAGTALGTQLGLSGFALSGFVANYVAQLNASLTGFPYDRLPGEYNETSSDRFGGGCKLDWKAAENHRILLGIDTNLTDVKSTQYTSVVTSTPVPGAVDPFDTIQENNFAAFLQDEWTVTDKLTALLSTRYDRNSIDVDNVSYYNYLTSSNATSPIENKSLDALSPRVALNFKAADNMSFRASWGKSFRAPTLAERFVTDAGLFNGNPNPALDKETMTAYELGMFKQFGEKVSVDIAGYINDYDDLIESRNINPTGWPIIFQYQNIAKARIWGIETSLNYRPTPDWSFNCAYSYMNAKNKTNDAASALAGSQNPDPEWLQYRPEHTASASATWKTNKKLAINLNGRYVSKYKAVSSYPNPEGENYPGDFIVMNLGAKYQFTKNISGSFTCKNLGNVQYEEAEWFRAPGRTFIAGIDLTY